MAFDFGKFQAAVNKQLGGNLWNAGSIAAPQRAPVPQPPPRRPYVAPQSKMGLTIQNAMQAGALQHPAYKINGLDVGGKNSLFAQQLAMNQPKGNISMAGAMGVPGAGTSGPGDQSLLGMVLNGLSMGGAYVRGALHEVNGTQLGASIAAPSMAAPVATHVPGRVDNRGLREVLSAIQSDATNPQKRAQLSELPVINEIAKHIPDVSVGDVLKHVPGGRFIPGLGLATSVFDPSARTVSKVGGQQVYQAVTDPLTYILPGGVARHGTEAVMSHIDQAAADEVARLTGRTIESAADRAAIHAGSATDAMLDPAVEAQVRAVREQAGNLMAKVRKNGVNGLSRDEIGTVNGWAGNTKLTKGLSFGTARANLPITTGEGIQGLPSQMFHELKSGIAGKLLGEGDATMLGRMVPNAEMKATLRGATGEELFKAFGEFRGGAARSAMERALGRRNAMYYYDATKGATAEEVNLARDAINGSASAAAELERRGQVELPQKLSDAFEKIASHEVERGVRSPEQMIKNGRYFPSPVDASTHEAMVAAGLHPTDESLMPTHARSFSENRRQLWNPVDRTGGVGIDAAAADTANNAGEQVSQRVFFGSPEEARLVGSDKNLPLPKTRAEAERRASAIVGAKLKEAALADPTGHAAIFLAEHPEIAQEIEAGQFSMWQDGRQALATHARASARREAQAHAMQRQYTRGYGWLRSPANASDRALSDEAIQRLRERAYVQSGQAGEYARARQALVDHAEQGAPQTPLEAALRHLTPEERDSALAAHDARQVAAEGEVGATQAPEQKVAELADRGYAPEDATKLVQSDYLPPEELGPAAHADVHQALGQADAHMRGVEELLNTELGGANQLEGLTDFRVKVRQAAEDLGIDTSKMSPPQIKAALQKEVDTWHADREMFNTKLAIHQHGLETEAAQKNFARAQLPNYEAASTPVVSRQAHWELKKQLNETYATLDPQRQALRGRIANLDAQIESLGRATQADWEPLRQRAIAWMDGPASDAAPLSQWQAGAKKLGINVDPTWSKDEVRAAMESVVRPIRPNVEAQQARVADLAAQRDHLQQGFDAKRQLDLEDAQTRANDIAQGSPGGEVVPQTFDPTLTPPTETPSVDLQSIPLDETDLAVQQQIAGLNARIAAMGGEVPAEPSNELLNAINDPAKRLETAQASRGDLQKQLDALNEQRNAATQEFLQRGKEDQAARRAAVDAAAKGEETPLVPKTVKPGSPLDEAIALHEEQTAHIGEFSREQSQPTRMQWQEQTDIKGPTGKYVPQAAVGGATARDFEAQADIIRAKWEEAGNPTAIQNREETAAALQAFHDRLAAKGFGSTPEEAHVAQVDQMLTDVAARQNEPMLAAQKDDQFERTITAATQMPRTPATQRFIDNALATQNEYHAWRTIATHAEKVGDPALAEIARIHMVAEELGHQASVLAARAGRTESRLVEGLAKAGAADALGGEIRRGAYDYLNYRSIAPGIISPNDMVEHVLGMQRATEPQNMNRFLQKWDGIIRWMKVWQIASPGFEFRIAMGHAFNNELAQITHSSYGKLMKLWVDNIRGRLSSAGKERWDTLTSIVSPGMALSEAGVDSPEAALRGMVEQKSRFGVDYSKRNATYWLGHGEQPGHGFHNLLSSKSYIPQTLSKATEKVQFFFRASLAMDVLEKGGSIEDAVQAINRFHFDYSDLSNTDRVIRHFVPFYTWTRKNIPLQMSMLMENPRVYSRYTSARNAIQGASQPDSVTPGYFNDFQAMRLPYTNKQGGHAYALPNLPFQDLNLFGNIADNVSKDSGQPLSKYLLDTGGPFATHITPIITAPIESMLGKSFYNGIPLKDNTAVDLNSMHWPGWLQKVAVHVPGLAQYDRSTGKYYMTQGTAYVVEKMIPLLAKQQRTSGSGDNVPGLIQFFTGINIKQNNPAKTRQLNAYLKSQETRRLHHITKTLRAAS